MKVGVLCYINGIYLFPIEAYALIKSNHGMSFPMGIHLLYSFLRYIELYFADAHLNTKDI